MEEILLNSKLKIEEFFESKQNYENKKNKMKKSKVKKPLKCILCQKKGGTNFYIQDKHYVIECDSFESKCKTTKTIIERIRKVLIDEYIKIFENHINKLIRDKNSIEYKKQYFNQDIDENLLKSINDKINDKQQKINILYQFIEDKKNKKEENIKILEEEKKNNITELKTELSFFQPDYEKILKIQKEIKEQDENIFRLKYSYNNLSEPISYSNKDTEFGDCVKNNDYVLHLQEYCLEELEELFDDELFEENL